MASTDTAHAARPLIGSPAAIWHILAVLALGIFLGALAPAAFDPARQGPAVSAGDGVPAAPEDWHGNVRRSAPLR